MQLNFLTMINILKVGGLVEIIDQENKKHLRNTGVKVELDTDDNDQKVSVSIGGILFYGAVTEVKFEGVAVTDYEDLKEKIALVFPNANSGSGGSTDLDDISQGSSNKYLSSADYVIVQQLIQAFTTT